MDGINNSFTKWCEDQDLTEDNVSGGTLVTAMRYLLNDAAVQKRGDEFDPNMLVRSRLEKMNKPQLITIVQNFAWFSHRVVEPYVTSSTAHWTSEFDRTRSLLNNLGEQRDQLSNRLEDAQAELDTLKGKVISLQDELLAEKNRTIE